MPTAEIFSAISHADTAAPRPLLGDDLRWVVGNSGAVFEKPQRLAAAAHSSPLVSIDYAIDSLRTRQHRDVATAEYRLTDRRTFREYQNVFVYRASDAVAPMIVFERDARGRVIGYVQQMPDGTITRARRLHPRVSALLGRTAAAPPWGCLQPGHRCASLNRVPWCNLEGAASRVLEHRWPRFPGRTRVP
jgi:hypothetical protein